MHPKHVERLRRIPLIKNGKFFQLPERSDDDFKTLFGRVAAAGVGRPVDKDGCPQGPWTPDLLADAISEIEVNRAGIELRTVQLWFENNDKGISANNIRWLARVLGCNDPEGASAWQAELSAAQARLTAKRRARRRGQASERDEPEEDEQETTTSGRPHVDGASVSSGLARATEAVFAGGSLLNLPAAVFAGAVALQLVSYFLSIHDVTHIREDGMPKQVGFLWAPNWTLLFIVFLPLFLAIVADQVGVWKSVNRAQLLSGVGKEVRIGEWLTRVDSSSHAYWAVLVICVGFAGVVQWVNVRLLPLLKGGGNYAVDWGSGPFGAPDQIGLAQLVGFTGAAYLYMCLCFYLLIAGLILLCNLIDDFAEVQAVIMPRQGVGRPQDVDASGSKIMRGLVRCTIAGLLVAMCMKLQTLYTVNSAPDLVSWLIMDAKSVLSQSGAHVAWDEAPSPTNYTSLLVMFLVCTVYLYGAIRIDPKGLSGFPRARATAAVALLVGACLSVGAFGGFSLLLGTSLLVAVYGLLVPDFKFRRHERRDRDYVL